MHKERGFGNFRRPLLVSLDGGEAVSELDGSDSNPGQPGGGGKLPIQWWFLPER